MDLGKFKSEANLKVEFEKYKQESEQKHNAIKKAEVEKISKGFLDFFKEANDFVITESVREIKATFNGASITLVEDEYENRQDPSMAVHLKITMPDETIHEISTTIKSNREIKILPPTKSQEEIMKRDLEYHKDFVNGDIVYSFKYYVKGKKKEYDTIGELLKEL